MHIHQNCTHCGKTFTIVKKEYDRQVRKGRDYFFCSRSCISIWRNAQLSKPDILKKCAVCGKEFFTRPTLKEGTFCSRSCASSGSVTDYRRERARVVGRINARTLIPVEQSLYLREAWKYAELEKYLKHAEVEHTFEFRIGRFVYDLALTAKKVLVEFDGPEHRTPLGLKRDVARDKTAEAAGWKVKRIAVEAGAAILPSMIYDL